MLQFQRGTKSASEYVNSIKDYKNIKILVYVNSHVMLTCLPVSYVYSHNVFDGNKLQSISSHTFLILTFFSLQATLCFSYQVITVCFIGSVILYK